MNHQKYLLVACALFSLTSLSAEASLTAGISGGQSVVYDSGSNITWTGDANLLGTLEDTYGYSTIIDAIIAASPKIYDKANMYDTPADSGYHTVSAGDFSHTYHSGEVSWFGAKAFVNYLNSINYAGSQQWVLPTTVDSNTSYVCSVCGGHTATSSQLEALYYTELGGNLYSSLFTNEQANLYWSGTDLSYGPGLTSLAWTFITSTGNQDSSAKIGTYFAWAVTAGNITAVPVPSAIWLFGTGLLALLGRKGRRLNR